MKPTLFQFTCPFTPLEFDFKLCVTNGQVFRWRQVGEARWVGAEGDHAYRVEILDSHLAIETTGSLEAFCTLFQLDRDLQADRQAIVADGPELGPYVAALPGLRTIRPSSRTETLFSFLCTSNNHLSRIAGMVEKLSRYGLLIAEFEGVDLYQFPSAHRLASVSETELRQSGFGYRGATIPLVAQAISERGGENYLNALAEGPYNVAFAALAALPGIGPKLADCICLYSLGHSEAVPIDTHILQALVRLYFPAQTGAALTPQKYQELTNFFRKRFGKNAGYAHQYLFYENVLNWRARKSGSKLPVYPPRA